MHIFNSYILKFNLNVMKRIANNNKKAYIFIKLYAFFRVKLYFAILKQNHKKYLPSKNIKFITLIKF